MVGAIRLFPRVGTAAVVAPLIVGQLLGSLAFEHFGVFGFAVHEASGPHLLGTNLLIAGAALMSVF